MHVHESKPVPKFRVGQRVNHAEFGPSYVKEIHESVIVNSIDAGLGWTFIAYTIAPRRDLIFDPHFRGPLVGEFALEPLPDEEQPS